MADNKPLYGIKELKEKFVEKIFGLGVDPAFKENPAFAHVLAEMARLLPQPDENGNYPGALIKDENGTISFSCKQDGKEYSYKIQDFDSKEFRFTRSVKSDYKLVDDIHGRMGTKQDCIEQDVVLSKEKEIEITTYRGTAEDRTLDSSEIYTSSEKARYASDGIMVEREYTTFPKSNHFSADRLEAGNLFDHAKTSSRDYDSKWTATRKFADVAFVYEVQRVNRDIKPTFRGYAYINQEHGLRDIRISPIIKSFDTVISPLSQQAIDEMIAREPNEKVKEGLRRISKDRDKFYYNPADDINYVNTTTAQAKTL